MRDGESWMRGEGWLRGGCPQVPSQQDGSLPGSAGREHPSITDPKWPDSWLPGAGTWIFGARARGLQEQELIS